MTVYNYANFKIDSYVCTVLTVKQIGKYVWKFDVFNLFKCNVNL
jgi:hypothetical protein